MSNHKVEKQPGTASATSRVSRFPSLGRRWARIIPAALALTALGTTPAFAASGSARVIAPKTIFMVTFANSSALNRLSPTGARTFIGTTGVPLTDLTFRANSLLAVSFSELYAINPTTARASFIGSLGFSDINALVTAPANGQLYAAGSVAPGRFVKVNPTTGRAQQIGSFGQGLSSAGDLAYLNGTMYGTVDRAGSRNTFLARINPATGHATLIGDTGYPVVWGLAVRNGVLLAATDTGVFLKLSPSTGHGTKIGYNGSHMAGLAISP